MFRFLFKYPSPVFTKGHFVLQSAWPGWLLPVAITLACGGLGLMVWRRLRDAAPNLRGWRAWALWAMQSGVVALLLLLLWQPAMTVAELSSQQNIIAVVVDDSRSMAIADVDGKPRESAALTALQNGVLAGLQKRFQTRIYRLAGTLRREEKIDAMEPTNAATHLGAGLKQLATETADLPVGAIVLLTDGSENTAGMGGSGIGADALQALRNRQLPVHTLALGRAESPRDVEMEDVSVAPTVVANGRVAASVSFTQHGYAGQKATFTVRDGNTAIASREVTLAADGALQSEPVYFPAGAAGAKSLQFGFSTLPGEANSDNNAMSRPVLVTDAKRRILYIEGEPRWEFRFLRRAEEDDPTVQLVSMLRTSENKLYRQGVSGPGELADGFPVRAEDLFAYSGIVIGSVDADYFTPLQQELLREYVDRRGGGILFLGGRSALSDGGWAASSLNELMPTFLPAGRSSFHRNPATAELTAAGVESPITRLVADPAKNAERWRKLTYMADYEDPGAPKPGATILVESHAGRRALPLLVTQNYGHGRTAIMATGGTWRWKMSEPLGDTAHDLFWQQLLQWLVADSPGGVTAAMPARALMDEGRAHFTAQVRTKDFQAAQGAHVSAHIVGPGNISALVDLTPSRDTPGLYEADWSAEKPGAYLAEVTADSSGAKGDPLGRDAITFQRQDAVAESFHTEANPRLLEQLASQTGGRAWTMADWKDLPRDISFSSAGISVRNTKELWNMPVVILLLLGLPVAEWLLRRKWGIV